MNALREVDQPRPGLRERKKAKTRALIQEHAIRLFSTQGYEETTVEQIAEAAEVSPSTLFRYFPTKIDIVRYDSLDPLVFEAYRAPPAELSPIGAARRTLREMLDAVPAQVLAAQWERARLILAIPELRAAVLDDTHQVEGLFADAEAARTGRRPDPFSLRILVGALAGTVTAVLQCSPEDAVGDYAAVMDRAFALLEAGLPL